MQQLLLDLFKQQYEFNNFLTIGNELAIANLQNFSNQFTHVYGPNLSGKTHLIKAWANLATQKYAQSFYLDCQIPDSAQILEDINLDEYRFIAVDNIDYLDDHGQIKLFDLFNHIKLNNRDNYLLTSSTINLNKSTLRRDLVTRIYSGLIFAIKSMDDQDLLTSLMIYVRREGIGCEESEIQFLLNHGPRNCGKLINLINTIANNATEHNRAITIPLIKSCLNKNN